VIRQIRKVLSGRVLRALRETADERPGDYERFWREFGAFIKQGVITSLPDRDDLLPLLRFHSSHSGETMSSLSAYVGRMTGDQAAIYYILGNDRPSVERSPHLDSFAERGLEVLYMFDPFDGVVVQSLGEYEGKPFQNVDDPSLELPELPAARAQAQPTLAQDEFEQLAARIKRVLGERVTEVRDSKVLTGSPCRLVSTTAGPDRDLERVRRLLEDDFEVPPRILEVNRQHPLIRSLAYLISNRPDDAVIDMTIEQLLDNLLLLEGLHPNPVQMVPRIQMLLETATRAESAADEAAPAHDEAGE
jgi:molecular chaperone HtpG